jgi:hypothetical protein
MLHYIFPKFGASRTELRQRFGIHVPVAFGPTRLLSAWQLSPPRQWNRRSRRMLMVRLRPFLPSKSGNDVSFWGVWNSEQNLFQQTSYPKISFRAGNFANVLAFAGIRHSTSTICVNGFDKLRSLQGNQRFIRTVHVHRMRNHWIDEIKIGNFARIQSRHWLIRWSVLLSSSITGLFLLRNFDICKFGILVIHLWNHINAPIKSTWFQLPISRTKRRASESRAISEAAQ